MGDREILEKYLNSASKNTSETDIFPNGTKPLLTSVISSTGRIKLTIIVKPRIKMQVFVILGTFAILR